MKNQVAIHAAREGLKKRLGTGPLQDLHTFVDVIFDFERFSGLIQKIDLQAQRAMTDKHPKLFDGYKKATAQKDPEHLQAFLEKQFLPVLRSIVHKLAQHYAFDSNYIESIGTILTDDDFMDYIEKGRLVLDIGEDGHGPLPHIIAAFVMAELQREGSISSAVGLYKSLSQRSATEYCPVRANFLHRFSLLLDSADPHAMFSNPSNFSNHLIFQSVTLIILAGLCKNHAGILSAIAFREWEQLDCKHLHTKGCIIDRAENVLTGLKIS